MADMPMYRLVLTLVFIAGIVIPEFPIKVDACTQYEMVTMVHASTEFESDYTADKIDESTQCERIIKSDVGIQCVVVTKAHVSTQCARVMSHTAV